MVPTQSYVTGDYIDTPDAVAAFIDAALEDGDSSIIASVVADIARSDGMSAITAQTGVTGEALTAAFGADGDPRLSALLPVLKAMGLRLAVVPLEAPATAETADTPHAPV